MANRILRMGQMASFGLVLLMMSCTTKPGGPTASTTQNAGAADLPPPDLRLWGVALDKGGNVWEHIGIENHSGRAVVVSNSMLVDWELSGKGFTQSGRWFVNNEVIRTADEWFPERYLILPSIPIYSRNTKLRVVGEVINVNNIPLDVIGKEVGDTSNLKDGRLTISVCLSIIEMDSAHQLHSVVMIGDLVHNWPAQARWYQKVALRPAESVGMQGMMNIGP
jgi:hypothetical protein